MKKTLSSIVLLLIVGALLIYWSRGHSPNIARVTAWKAAGINCLTEGEANLQTHIHPELRIIVDGKNEVIPANTGITPECFSDIHTHDTTGVVHVESYLPDRKATLGQFLTVLGKPIMRSGYNVTMTVDNATSTAYDTLLFKDGQKTVLDYKTKK